jgi:hypothetical protein
MKPNSCEEWLYLPFFCVFMPITIIYCLWKSCSMKMRKKNYPCHLPRHLTAINFVQGVSLQQEGLVSSATSFISYMLYDITVHTAWCWKLEYYGFSRLNSLTNQIISTHKQVFNTYFLTFTHVSINQDHLDEDTDTESKCCCQALHCIIRILQNSHKYLS